jgi:hypothetical protein
MRIVFLVLAVWLATLAPAHATIGFACSAKDSAATVAVSGRYALQVNLARFRRIAHWLQSGRGLDFCDRCAKRKREPYDRSHLHDRRT